MSITHMERLFCPASVAVVGASDKPQRIGTRVLANLAGGGYGGAIWPVNPKYQRLLDLPCYPRVAALPDAPDLAILCTPPDTIPGLVAELGARGTRAAIVMTAGLAARQAGGGRSLQQAMLGAARPHQLRILGPGSVGLLTPALGLNASFNHLGAAPGKLAFVSQSGALGAAVLDWASLRGIGFSSVCALGDMADIDVGDVLDYLAADTDTAAILLCLEQISCARKFMSAGRVAARGKPVIVLKVGRDPSADAEQVFDAALRRAGMLRVYSTEDLFDAVETLAHQRGQRGERLALLTNGGGLSRLAADALRDGGALLAQLSPDTAARLRRAGAADTNPVDLLADTPVERYAAAAAALLAEPQTDALLFLHAPTAMVEGRAVAQALAPLLAAAPRNVLSCWLGGRAAAGARQVFAEAGLPTYDTPEKAVRGFLQLAQYRRIQDLLMEVPGAVPLAAAPERAAAAALVEATLAAGRERLDDSDTAALLAAYGITLQPCLKPASTAVAAIRVVTDPVFGPAIHVGQGGVAAEVVHDSVAGLPPLNLALARDMLGRTRAAALLGGGAAVAEALGRLLVQVAGLVADIPGLHGLALDPVLVQDGVLRVGGASMVLGPAAQRAPLAIRPYPQEQEQQVQWQGRTLLLRPIRPEDGPQHQAFFHALDPDDVRLRFFTVMRELPPAQLARLTQIDYDRAMAFIATRPGANGVAETLGVARAVADADNQRAEFAIVVRSDLKGQGLGRVLFEKLTNYFRSRGTAEICGEALAENAGVQHLIRRFGGVVLPHPEAGMVRLRLPLR
ncbi:bifunctional acetate--CoA ligase family protein/GNAT family N-acetyltransferase [Oxalobacteraceae bacterium A2-2]